MVEKFILGGVVALMILSISLTVGFPKLNDLYRFVRKSRLPAWFMIQDPHTVHKADLANFTWPAHLESRLNHQERRRKRELAASRFLYVLGAIIACATVYALLNDPEMSDRQIAVYLVVLTLCWALAYLVREPPSMSFRRQLIEHFAAAKGLTYFHGLQPKGDLDHARQVGVLPQFLDGSVLHGLNGDLSGSKISMMEAQLWRGYGANRRNNFDGILIKTILPHPVDFLIYICPKRKGSRHEFAQSLPSNIERCRLESGQFESEFAVFTNRQTEARALLSPSYIETLTALTQLWPNAPMHIAIRDRFLFISVDAASLFPPQPHGIPLHSPVWVGAILAELNAIEHLVSALRPFQRPGMSI